MSEITDGIQAATGLIKEIKDTKTAKELDKTSATLVGTVNALLTPLKVFTYFADKKFEQLTKNIDKKLKGIPPEKIQPPPMHIAVPAIKAAAYSMDSEALRNMYANLLARSMLPDLVETIHTGFVEVISQMTPGDAKLLLSLHSHSVIPMLSLSSKATDEIGSNIFIRYLIEESISPRFEYNYHAVEVSISNLNRLGIIIAETDRYLVNENWYSPLIDSFFVKNLIKSISDSNVPGEPTHELQIDRKMIEITPFGKSFIQVCLTDLPSPPISSPVPQVD